MKKIAIGLEKNTPSWSWVGFDTTRELAKYYEVYNFNNFKSCYNCDCIIFIKQIPTEKVVDEAIKRKIKTIYCPIDFYKTQSELIKTGPILKKINHIITHCSRLTPILKIFNQRTTFIDHNDKFSLPTLNKYKSKGFVLWIGSAQYTSYLIKYLENHPIKLPVKICTDIHNDRATYAAKLIATNLKVRFNFTPDSINNIEVVEWSEKSQFDMLKECKAAIDIKGVNEWAQHNKPPTKAQKYIGSGIPFAINRDSYATENFKKKYNFNIVEPTDQGTWFSEEYWEKTYEVGQKLRVNTSIEAIGKEFKRIIDSL
jgi:hypothetical protein